MHRNQQMSPLLSRSRLHRRASFSTCSICLSVLHEGCWLDVDEAINALRTYEHESIPRLKSGLCDRCETGVRRRRLSVAAQEAA